MNIDIANKDIKKLVNDADTFIHSKDKTETKLLKNDVMRDLRNIFSDKGFLTSMKKVEDFNQNKKFDYEQLCEVEDNLSNISNVLTRLKENVDLEIFLRDGYTLDVKKVREKFNKKNLKKEFPNFKFKRLKELYEHPPEELPTYYNPDQKIKVDDFVFRKYILAILQMVLDHMDFVVAVTGGEGTGKSTHVSQLMYMVHYIIEELEIVKHKFDIKECFFNTLEKLRLKEDEYFDQPFRIFTLDEGNQLHRQNWKDDEVATFFQRLRRERHNRRIKFICIPVLGELISNIVITRVNFITEMVNTNDIKTGSLNKGMCNFYIVPRGQKIFSPAQKRDITKAEIKNALHLNLKDKTYLTGMPKEILVKSYACNGVWGFPHALYIKELKDSNKTFTVSGGIKLSDTEAFYMYMARISLKAIGLSSKDVKYATINKFFNRLKNYWEDDPDKYNKYNLILQRKEEEKAQKED